MSKDDTVENFTKFFRVNLENTNMTLQTDNSHIVPLLSLSYMVKRNCSFSHHLYITNHI